MLIRPPRRLVAQALAALCAIAASSVYAAPESAATTASPTAGAFGVVMGVDGRVYQHARVCIDRHRDARCDPGERTVFTDAAGRFALPRRGAIVAEIGSDTVLVDSSTGARFPVERPLVFRAPAGDTPGPRAVGPLSTEVVAMMDGEGSPLGGAMHDLAQRLRVSDISVTRADSIDNAALADRPSLVSEQAAVFERIASATAEAGSGGDRVNALASRLDLARIANVVVIYAENHSFNNLFANFPGARGLAAAMKNGAISAQRDRDRSVLAKLPPAWGGLTAAGQAIAVTQAQTTNVLPNAPFQIDAAAPAWGAPAVTNAVITRDLYHRFYENQMQIDGGANDRFAAWSDAGGLAMGYFDGSRTAMWQIARRYTLADNFFQGAFGGSFLNHQYLVCACAPDYPDADTSPAHPTIAVLRVGADGKPSAELALASNSPASALDGPPVYVRSGNLTPKDYLGDGTFHAVNTMQPAYQPSFNPPAPDDTTVKYANPLAATTLPAQTRATIGDMLDARDIAWAWYAGGWNDAAADRSRVYDDKRGGFQSHHQPFNYYASLDPVTHSRERAAHLKDEADLLADAAAGKLPPVAFYKPVGTYNEHPGATSLALGDAHIASLIDKLQSAPQWKHMLIIVTYDENGGQWDEVAPPKGDRVGPGTRIPAVVISPFARRAYVDHTQYDTGSIARFLTHRFSLPLLPGLQVRDTGLQAHGFAAMGDLTDALDFSTQREASR